MHLNVELKSAYIEKPTLYLKEIFLYDFLMQFDIERDVKQSLTCNQI